MYLIQKLWIDPMENRNADGYEPFGYVDTLQEAKDFCEGGRIFTQKDCWSLFIPTPEFIYQELPYIG